MKKLKKTSIGDLYYSMIANRSFLDFPENIENVLIKFDNFESLLTEISIDFYIDFYKHPIDKNMASNVSSNVLFGPPF